MVRKDEEVRYKSLGQKTSVSGFAWYFGLVFSKVWGKDAEIVLTAPKEKKYDVLAGDSVALNRQ